MYVQVSAVQYRVNGDIAFLLKTAKFDPLQIQNASTNWDEIWNI